MDVRPVTADAESTLRAYDRFLETGSIDERIRSLVAASWRRSKAAGLDVDADLAPVTMERQELVEYRAAHQLSRVFPLLYDILGRIAEDCECVMALGDEYGQLLWVCGQPDVLRRAESIHFAEGTLWDESTAGTNAPGTALRLDAPVVIASAEHFTRPVQSWSCAAAPIHDPRQGSILGILDVTGSADVATPQTLGMVRAAARMAEIELARIAAVESALPRPTATKAVAALRVQALGRPDCAVEEAGRTIRLSPRHSEILLALMTHPAGLTAEQLEVEIYPEGVTTSTMRAEITRLRSLLGQDLIGSRPYRILGRTTGDWQAVEEHLSAGRLREACADYRGPLLPHSDAPGVVAARDALHSRLRSALLCSDDPDLLAAWTRTRWGADDLDAWRRQLEVLPPGSPLRGPAAAELARLNRLLA